jgi:hypothetical protein
MIYRATVPPEDATCDSGHCGTVARVRVAIPPHTWDSCDLHWPAFRAATMRNGHQIADGTGDLRELLREYPDWRVFRSDLGRLYATRPGLTVYGWLCAQLRAEIVAAQVAALQR